MWHANREPLLPGAVLLELAYAPVAETYFPELAVSGKVFQQTVGIPMGTNCAPLLADNFLYSYEANFIQSLLSMGKKHLESRFNLTYRYIDDVLSINTPEFENYLGQMYPAALEIKNTTESSTSASYLDYYCRLGGMVNFVLPSTTNEMISISTSQTFRS